MQRKYVPMLLSTAHRVIDSEDWCSEIKWDGYRAITYVTPERTQIVSRNGKDLCDLFPELAGLYAHTGAPVVLDGEIVKLGPDGLPDFNLMRSRSVPATLVAFDILEQNDRVLINQPLRRRRDVLKNVIGDECGPILRSRQYDDAQWLYEQMVERNGEGIVEKRLDSIYCPGMRTSAWVKIHTPFGREAVAMRGERFYRER